MKESLFYLELDYKFHILIKHGIAKIRGISFYESELCFIFFLFDVNLFVAHDNVETNFVFIHELEDLGFFGFVSHVVPKGKSASLFEDPLDGLFDSDAILGPAQVNVGVDIVIGGGLLLEHRLIQPNCTL